ncbi:FAD:protein FMN transferase [Alistipes sp. ZOR0009]|uniref:FAD:protein FMN transferase n=1 Tax=Alistipes sp. ZOR0009 TaxID=1339253 RepID=UPI0006466F37|nr:FAD:protein FMN transferase [Alistipes sp. ZOR0009]
MMKKLLVVLAACAVLFSSCNSREKEYVKISGFAQGTTYSMSYRDAQKRNLQPQVDSILKNFDQSLSIYCKTSIITRINNNDTTVRTDAYFDECYKLSEEVYQATNGAFDITVGPLVQAWGFGLKKRDKITKERIDSILPLVGMGKVKLVDGKLIKSNPSMFVDVNAIAQGYSVDVIARYFESKGINEYLVEIGGETLCKGLNSKGKAWVIGIDKPFDNNVTPGQDLQAKVALPSGKALATSGSYRKFFEENGVKYSHELDPKTGYPAHNTLLSISVVANNCALADGYATAFMVMGVDKAKEFLAKRSDMDAFMVYSGPKGEFLTYATSGFDKMLIK